MLYLVRVYSTTFPPDDLIGLDEGYRHVCWESRKIDVLMTIIGSTR